MASLTVAERNAADALGKMIVGSAADWRAAGLSARRLRSLVSSGQLVKIRRGAYATSEVLAEAETDPGLRHALDVAAVRAARARRGVASMIRPLSCTGWVC